MACLSFGSSGTAPRWFPRLRAGAVGRVRHGSWAQFPGLPSMQVMADPPIARDAAEPYDLKAAGPSSRT